MNLQDLKKVIPHKWRVQSFSKNKAMAQCVPYIDARDAMELLDQVCGPDNWSDEYYQVKNTMCCKIGIYVKGTNGVSEWVWKSDGGTETDIESEKGEISDSFKRAAVKWGIGRFLYSLETVYLPANAVKADDKIPQKKELKYEKYPYVVDAQGKRVWDITKEVEKQLATKNNQYA